MVTIIRRLSDLQRGQYRQAQIYLNEEQRVGNMKTSIEMFGWMLLVAVTTVTAIEKIPLHDEMTDEEIERVFRTKRDSVPEYDVVPISFPKRHKRSYESPTEIRLNAFGRSIDLLLTPSEGILAGKKTPVYMARSDKTTKSGFRFTQIYGLMEKAGKLFTDTQNGASLVVRKSSNGKFKISGHVESEGWVVSPLPSRLNSRYRRSIADGDDLENANALHVITKIPPLPTDAVHGSLDNVFVNKTTRSKRSAPAIIYPQILVVVDYKSFQSHKGSPTRLVDYLLGFWNGVDIKYRTLEKPKVRLNIAGIIVAAETSALPFISDYTNPNETLRVYPAIGSFASYMHTVKSDFPSESYDIAIAMTTYAMCMVNDTECGILGLAHISGACVFRQESVISSAIVKDAGGFDGVHTAAHELGHLFGAHHDGQNNASACSHETGNIMSPSTAFMNNPGFWSPCSWKQFTAFFNSDTAKCLFNKPDVPQDSALPRVLPGSLLTPDGQCMGRAGTMLCEKDHGENICERLWCVEKNPKSSYPCMTPGPAADGTICGDEKICYQGRCQNEIDIN